MSFFCHVCTRVVHEEKRQGSDKCQECRDRNTGKYDRGRDTTKWALELSQIWISKPLRRVA